MLFADEIATTWPQVVSMVGGAAVAAWLAIERFRVSSRVTELQTEALAERKRCDALDARVKKLESMLRALGKRKPRR